MDNLLNTALASQQQARQQGFDWPSAIEVIDKAHEELAELLAAYKKGNTQDIQDEYGDVLLVILNLSLHLNLDIKSCLNLSLDKFNNRYKAMLELTKKKKLIFDNLTLKEKECIWQEIKK